MAAPEVGGGTLFVAAFDVRRDAPVANLSRKLPRLRIVQWCPDVMDIFQVSGPEDEVESFKERVLADFGIRQAHSTADGVLILTQLCKCGVEESKSMTAIMRSVWAWDIPPIVYREGWESRRVIAWSEGSLRELFKSIRTIGELRIVSMRPIENFQMEKMMLMPASEVFSGLTDRQSSALLLGLRHGYYAMPSETKVDRLAGGLGLSPSTVSEHLRKAEARILQNLRPYLEAYSIRSPGAIAVAEVRGATHGEPRQSATASDT